MRRATITLPDDLDEAVMAYQAATDTPPTLNALVTAALRSYLAERGRLPRPTALRLTPATVPSGLTDISVEHDREIAAQ